jgi:hypothetical protein
LSSAIELSRCNQFAHEQFRHAAGGVYIEQRVLDSIQEQIRAYERGIIEDAELVEQEADEDVREEEEELEQEILTRA